ncbi:hypothetical protein ScPMuIL_000529 [Solemya velum]
MEVDKLLLVPILVSLFLVVQPVNSQSGIYFAIAPKTVQTGEVYKVAVGILDTPNSVTASESTSVVVKLSGSSNVQMTDNILRGSSKDFKLAVPSDWRDSYLTLSIVGTGGAVFSNETRVKVEKQKGIVMIQTDKPIYKPGQKVQFRTLLLNENLRPSEDPVSLAIKDGNGNKIKEWNNEPASFGVVSKDLQLSSDPVLNNWTIVATQGDIAQEQQFRVEHYVLPRFETTLTVESSVSEAVIDLPVKVEAKYTFGKHVSGVLKLEVKLAFTPPPINGWMPLGRFHEDIRMPAPTNEKILVSESYPSFNGVLETRLNIPKMKNTAGFSDDSNYGWNIVITAKVSEGDEKGELQMESKQVKIVRHMIKAQFLDNMKVIHPGLNFYSFFKVSNLMGQPIGDYTGYRVVFTIEFGDISEEWNEDAIPVDGTIPVKYLVPEMFSSVTLKAVVELNGEKVAFASLHPLKYISKQASSIQITEMEGNSELAKNPTKINELGDTLTFLVEATFSNQKCYYAVMSQGKMVKFESFPLDENNKASFAFSLDRSLIPHAYILVFSFVHPANGVQEIIADGIGIRVAHSFENQVTIAFNKEQAETKERVSIDITASPNSYVGVAVVDKAVLLLAESNDISRERYLDELSRLGMDKEKPHFSSWYRPAEQATDHFFLEKGVVCLTDVHMEKAINYNDGWQNMRPEIDEVKGPTGGATGGNEVVSRTYFPETWLWQHYTTSVDGDLRISDLIVPDSITSWVASAFSMSKETGLGIPDKNVMLRAFQNFFVQLILPYSVKRGETLMVDILVFNYFDAPVMADVVLEESNDFHVLENPSEIDSAKKMRVMESISVPSQSNAKVTVWILPKTLKDIDVIASAKTVRVEDRVQRKLLVVPEGQQRYSNRQWFIQFDGSNMEDSMTFVRNITDDYPLGLVPAVVEGSWKCEVQVIGEIIGPALDGVDKLVRMPTGCGEQNMIYMAPNVVLLQYYKRASKSNPKLENRAREFTEQGYQRELRYKHLNHGYSAFGESDDHASTWLTAFVLKSFCQAKEFVPDTIEQDQLRNTAQWLITQQNKDGLFIENGRVIHADMQGGAIGSEETMSAYVLIALLECGASTLENTLNPNAIQNAIVKTVTALKSAYLNGNLPKKPYTLALVGYALQLANENEVVRQILADLDKIASDKDGVKSWIDTNGKKQPPKFGCQSNNAPLAVEIASYNLLIRAARKETVEGMPVLKFLINMGNPLGGFCSTQDTVIGLQAVSEFAFVLAASADLDISLTPAGGSVQNFDHIGPDSMDILQRKILSSDTKTIEVRAKGTGVAIVQAIWKYHILGGKWESGLGTKVEVTSIDKHTIETEICVSNQGEKNIGMSIVEATMFSGFEPVMNQGKMKNAARVDIDKDKVTIYLNEVLKDEEESCFAIRSKRIHNVNDVQPAMMTFSDYYNPEKETMAAISFPEANIIDRCATCQGQCRNCDGYTDTSSHLTWSSLIFTMAAILIIFNHQF